MNEKINEQLLAPPRGTRDFEPKLARMRENLLDVIRTQFRNYGFEPLSTPAFENYAVLSAKFAGGEEILKETYRFSDQGQRPLGLRYDFTVPLCRYVSSNPSIPKPFKRYSIGPVWRDGPLKTGRYREFVQCDADVVGSALPIADAEILCLAVNVFQKLGLKVIIKLNNRKLLNALLEKAGIADGEQQSAALLILDKLEKAGWQAVGREWTQKGLGQEALDVIKTAFTFTGGDNISRLKTLQDRIGTPASQAAVGELQQVLEYAAALGCPAGAITIDPSLARGLNYYTGSIFEAVLVDGESLGLTSSLAAGGRYDNIIGGFSANKTPGAIPAVGISFGLDILMDALNITAKATDSTSSGSVYVFSINQPIATCICANVFRSAGLSCSIDVMGRSLSKNLEFAARNGFSYAVIIGPKEIEAKMVRLRDLSSGVEKLLNVEQAVLAISNAKK